MRYFEKYGILIFFILLTIIFTFLSINQANQEDEKGDFYVYWNTGQKFMSDKPLYEFGRDDGAFIYPPFAAMVFSAFSLLSFNTAAIFYALLINYGLWVLSLWLAWKILKDRFPFSEVTLPFVVGVLCSARYFWHNFIWMQANLPMLCAVLAGIYFYGKEQRNAAYLFFLAGAFFKVTPVLLIIFILIKSRFSDWRKVVTIALAFILFPMLFRGFYQGLKDWEDYYHAFFSPFARGKVDGDLISLGLPSLLYKLKEGSDFLNIAPALGISWIKLKKVILVLNLSLLLGVTVKVLAKNRSGNLSGSDFCLILLLILILPGRVWEHHHVTLLLVISYLMACLQLLMPPKQWVWFAVPIFITGIIGTDTVGATIYDHSQFYCLITLVVFYLLIIVWHFGYRAEKIGVILFGKNR